MNTHSDSLQDNSSQAVANSLPKPQHDTVVATDFEDNTQQYAAQRKHRDNIINSSKIKQLRAIQQLANNSNQVKQLKIRQAMADDHIKSTAQLMQASANAAVIQLRRIYNATDGVREEIPADRFDAGNGEWYLYMAGGELVYVHIDMIVDFIAAFPDAQIQDDAPQDEPVAGIIQDGPQMGEGLEDAGAVEDRSRILHFQDRRDEDNIVRRNADPDEVEHGELAAALVPDALPGQIMEVRYMVPENPANHFEVICLVAVEEGDSEEDYQAVKFDFNRNGYRMIYGADPDANGDRAQRGESVPPHPVTLQQATTAFARVAAAGGSYREGANECGTFARNFYRELMGHDAEGGDEAAAVEEEDNGGEEADEVQVHPSIPLHNRFAPLADLTDENDLF